MSDKAAAELLREVVEGMTDECRYFSKTSDHEYFAQCERVRAVFVQLLRFANCADELVALVQAVEIEVDGPGEVAYEYEQKKIVALDALRAKLEEKR